MVSGLEEWLCQCLLCKHEDLNLDCQQPQKSQKWRHDHRARRVPGSQLASLVGSVSSRLSERPAKVPDIDLWFPYVCPHKEECSTCKHAHTYRNTCITRHTLNILTAVHARTRHLTRVLGEPCSF